MLLCSCALSLFVLEGVLWIVFYNLVLSNYVKPMSITCDFIYILKYCPRKQKSKTNNSAIKLKFWNKLKQWCPRRMAGKTK